MATSGPAFSSDGADVIQRAVQEKTLQRSKEEDIEETYEIARCSSWIVKNDFKKVSLQFPDELLPDSTAVAQRLQKCTSAAIFILGDTSYGSCCVDEVAAQHYNADAVIHFGHACLSPTKRYPVLYVFGRQPIDVGDCANKFQELFPKGDEKVVLLYDTVYAHAIGDVEKTLLVTHPNVLISKFNLVSDDLKSQEESTKDNMTINKVSKCGRTFECRCDASEEYSMFFIGGESLTLTNLIMNFNKFPFYSYDPSTRIGRKETLNVNKMLMKRFRNVELAKDAQIVGIVAGTLGVADYLSIINRLKTITKTAGKKSYTFVMGKINVPKMANFMEIDVFVLVACPENTLFDSSEFYKPVITPYEMELACNPNQQWDGTFISDYREILPGGQKYQEMPETVEMSTDVSLITGSMRTLGTDKEDNTDQNESAVMSRNDMFVVANTKPQNAGEFLKSRTWKGVEENLGETPVTAALEGRKGIASGYTHENEPS